MTAASVFPAFGFWQPLNGEVDEHAHPAADLFKTKGRIAGTVSVHEFPFFTEQFQCSTVGCFRVFQIMAYRCDLFLSKEIMGLFYAGIMPASCLCMLWLVDDGKERDVPDLEAQAAAVQTDDDPAYGLFCPDLRIVPVLPEMEGLSFPVQTGLHALPDILCLCQGKDGIEMVLLIYPYHGLAAELPSHVIFLLHLLHFGTDGLHFFLTFGIFCLPIQGLQVPVSLCADQLVIVFLHHAGQVISSSP